MFSALKKLVGSDQAAVRDKNIPAGLQSMNQTLQRRFAKGVQYNSESKRRAGARGRRAASSGVPGGRRGLGVPVLSLCRLVLLFAQSQVWDSMLEPVGGVRDGKVFSFGAGLEARGPRALPAGLAQGRESLEHPFVSLRASRG